MPRELLLLSLTLPVSLTLAMLRGIGQGRGRFKAIRAERFSSALGRLVVLAMLFALGAPTPARVGWVTLLAAIAACIFLVPALRSTVPPGLRTVSAVTPAQIVRYAAAAALATTSGMLVLRLDQMLMIPFCSPADLGCYAVAAAFAEVPVALIGAVRDVAFTDTAKRGSPGDAADWCRLSTMVLAPVCLGGILAAPQLVPLLYGPGFDRAIPMTQVLFVGTLASMVVAILGTGLMNGNFAATRAWIQAGGAALTVPLLLVFLPLWGGLGAALATTATYGAMALGSLTAFISATGVRPSRCFVPTTTDIVLLGGGLRSCFIRLHGVSGRKRRKAEFDRREVLP